MQAKELFFFSFEKLAVADNFKLKINKINVFTSAVCTVLIIHPNTTSITQAEELSMCHMGQMAQAGRRRPFRSSW